MKLAIMQPYFFPYIGYFQLINAVDKFILLDNVNFIKQGYINRNTILANGQPSKINIKINGMSSNKQILEHTLDSNPIWKKKLLKTITQNYQKATNFECVFPIIEEILMFENLNLSVFLFNQIKTISNFLNINTQIVDSASIYETGNLKAEERIIEICKQAEANTYINAIGGKNLYSNTNFKKRNIDLKFIKMGEIKYMQFDNDFIPNLSIIDVLMFNPKEKVIKMLYHYSLI